MAVTRIEWTEGSAPIEGETTRIVVEDRVLSQAAAAAADISATAAQSYASQADLAKVAAQSALGVFTAPTAAVVDSVLADPTSAASIRQSTTFARRVDVQPVSARGAVTISWDDGWLEWYTNLLPMLRDEFPHQNHTFAYTPGLLDNPNGLYQTTAQAQELAAALPHCEIASHSQTHANMKNSTVPVRVAEYDDSKANLETIFGVPVTSFVYPFGGVGQDDSTNRELYGRYDRVVSAGNPMAATPLDDRFGMFITPRLDEWQSSSHQRMLAEVRKAAAQPVIVNIYSHRAGTTTTLAELRELFTLCDTLGVPVINIRDAYPAGGILTNPGAEQGVLGWPGLGATGTGKVFDTVTVTPDTGMPGTQAFHLSSPTDPTGFIYASQYVPAVEGRSYTLSGRAKIAYVAGTGSYAKIRYQPMDLAGVNLGGTVASADAVASWTRLTAAGVMPAGTKQVRIDFILLNTQGEAWFDHLHFAPTSAGSLG